MSPKHKWKNYISKTPILDDTVDGRNPIPNHLGCKENLVNNGISTTFPSTGDRRISAINMIFS